MEAKRAVSDHRKEVQDHAAKAEAREDQHVVCQFQKYACAPCLAQAVFIVSNTA